MSLQADMVIQGADGQPLAIVELKNRKGLTKDVGVGIRRDLVGSHRFGARAPFLLLLSQEAGFLWTGPLAESPDEPAYTFPMAEVIGHYLPELLSDQWLAPDTLRLVVLQWLYDLIDGRRGQESEAERSLADAGLLDALWRAKILEGAPA